MEFAFGWIGAGAVIKIDGLRICAHSQWNITISIFEAWLVLKTVKPINAKVFVWWNVNRRAKEMGKIKQASNDLARCCIFMC